MNATGKGGFAEHPENINRDGRPVTGEAVTDILRSTVNKQFLVDKLIELASNGDLQALKYCIDRLDGKPIETVNSNVTQLPRVVRFSDAVDTDEDTNTLGKQEEA